MEQIETQASDLRYLARAPPVALTGIPYEHEHEHEHEHELSQQQQQPQPRGGEAASSCSADYGENSALADDSLAGNAHKRKPVDLAGGSKQTRSKRNRYTSIACNECKRRKIKCNGETPCQRCGNLNLACLYAPNCCSNSFKDSDEFRTITAHLSSLQGEVNLLNENVRALQSKSQSGPLLLNERSGIEPLATSSQNTDPAPAPAPVPAPESNSKGVFKGSTSAAYCLDVANATISKMGWKSSSDETDEPETMPAPTRSLPSTIHGGDPLLDFDEDEMVRLCRLHDDEIGILYPVLNIQDVIAHAKGMSPFFENLRKRRSQELINDEKTMQLKIVICCALATEGHGRQDKAVRLYESMDAIVNRRFMVESLSGLGLPVVTLVAGYRFLCGDGVLAWRVMGQVVRLCVELGVHHRRGLERIQDDAERKDAMNSFWSAYVLDRRWAFETGLPFTINDDDIDPTLPMPEEHPYLVAMITFSKLAAKIWRQVSHFGPVLARELDWQEIERLDREIQAWYESVPDDLRVRNWKEEEKQRMLSTPPSSYSIRRLRIWTYLRQNQIRIWLYTPILHSATSIMSNLKQAQVVVDIAKDSIQYLTHVDKTSSLYRKTFYHQFLAPAISVVFLACVHAPVPFAGICRAEFYMGIDLLKDMSAKSLISQRFWRAVRSLKNIAPRFGLSPDEDPQSTAALGMIGLARGHMETMPVTQAPYHHHNQDVPMPPPTTQPPMPDERQGQTYDIVTDSNTNLGHEFSRIFETYVGSHGYDGSMVPSDMPSPDSRSAYPVGDAAFFAFMREML